MIRKGGVAVTEAIVGYVARPSALAVVRPRPSALAVVRPRPNAVAVVRPRPNALVLVAPPPVPPGANPGDVPAPPLDPQPVGPVPLVMPPPNRGDDPAILIGLDRAREQARIPSVQAFFEQSITRIREAGPGRAITAELWWELMALDFKSLPPGVQNLVWSYIGPVVRRENLLVWFKGYGALIVTGDLIEAVIDDSRT